LSLKGDEEEIFSCNGDKSKNLARKELCEALKDEAFRAIDGSIIRFLKSEIGV
jgi:hypothetical protein